MSKKQSVMDGSLKPAKRERGKGGSAVSKDDKPVRLNVETSPARRNALKMRALEENRSITDIVNGLIDDYLAK